MAKGDRNPAWRQAARTPCERFGGPGRDRAPARKGTWRWFRRHGTHHRIGGVRSGQPFLILEARLAAVRGAGWNGATPGQDYGLDIEHAFSAFGKAGTDAADAGALLHGKARDNASHIVAA